MKRLLILVVLLLNVSLMFSQENIKQGPDSMFLELSYRDTNFHMYYVKKITKVKNGHSILLCREIDGNKDCFNVLTTKYGKKRQGDRIKRKRYYYLKIYACYEFDYIPNIGMIYNAEVHGKVVAAPPNQLLSNIYTSPNLNGLRYIPPNNAQKKNK